MKPGDYMLHRMHGTGCGTLVRIDGETAPGRFSVQYVQIMHDGSDVIGGGSSSSWPKSDFIAVRDPKHLAACKCFEARRQLHDLKHRTNALERDAEIWRRVVQVMHEGSLIPADDQPTTDQ